jgi:hypothetical protein
VSVEIDEGNIDALRLERGDECADLYSNQLKSTSYEEYSMG